ncbi:MAG: bifunctional molybdenum cofactor biosynthesis protein MoaC/MoaB [Propionibacteriaceae bacterium]|jgi:cyclic pyranopterin phosphate synthase|nr:bifunctional molybdenum cofactor biosynthesis protein MoaC/MoaB [Propionibacteriaceae bacterium]
MTTLTLPLPPTLTHADAAGHVHMVDVSDKAVTRRVAVARGRVECPAAALQALATGTLPKGDGLAVARVAGIQAAKRTGDLIPLCHPIGIDGVTVELKLAEGAVEIEAAVTSTGRTGAEMEALTAVTVAGLTVIDMVKGLGRDFRLTDVAVVAKSGGRSGTWAEPPAAPGVAAGHSAAAPAAPFAAGYVIVSDRCAAGTAVDRVGPLLAAGLGRLGAASVAAGLVADDPEAIRAAVQAHLAAGCRVVVTSGGTGLGPRDRTPEALAPLIATPVPGLAEALRARGRVATPAAALGRTVAGLAPAPGGPPALVLALPGAAAAVTDALDYLGGVLSHLLDQVDGLDHGSASYGGGR